MFEYLDKFEMMLGKVMPYSEASYSPVQRPTEILEWISKNYSLCREMRSLVSSSGSIIDQKKQSDLAPEALCISSSVCMSVQVCTV